MSAQEVEEEASATRGFAASLISVIVLLVVLLGISAYWWRVARITTCAPDHLRLSLGQPSGTAGTTGMDAVLTNTGPQRCALPGSAPGVSLASSNGVKLGSDASTPAGGTVPELTIAHEASVHAVLRFPNAANFQSGVCSIASNYLRVIPSGLTTSLQIPFTQYRCPGFSVTALQPGV
jgi:hypothetical protein